MIYNFAKRTLALIGLRLLQFAFAMLCTAQSSGIVLADESTLSSNRRSQISPERAAHREALLGKIFPGGTLDWDREEIVFPDGRRQRFSFSFLNESTMRSTGELFLMAATSPEDSDQKAIENLQQFRPASLSGHGCKLYFMRMEKTGKVLGFKQAAPDVSSLYTACTRADLENAYPSAGAVPPQFRGLPEPEWPWVFIQLSTVHHLQDAWGIVTWAAVVDSATGNWVSRLPVWINGAIKNKGEISFAIRNDRGEKRDGKWLFYGLSGRGDTPEWSVQLPCQSGSCIVPPESILNTVFTKQP